MRAGIFASVITLLCSAKKLLQKKLPLGGKLARKRLMRGDNSAPHRNVPFNRTGTTHGSFPTTLFPMGYALYRGVTRRARPACRSALPLTNRARSRTLQQIHTSQSNKNFPQEHPHQTKRTKFSHCMGGRSWGKFGVGQGGLEGRETPPKGVSLRLQGLPFSPTPDCGGSETRE